MIQNLNISRSLATATKVLPNGQAPPPYTLATLRAFPSLEPVTCIPVSTNILGVPLRRDILWRAVVQENDNRRVGASNPPGRSENGYSRHKGARALARHAPNDYTTLLPNKVHSLAYRTALSHQYKQGNLFIIGDSNGSVPLNETDSDKLDIQVSDGTVKPNFSSVLFKKFMSEHNLEGKRLLFVTSETRPGLLKYTDMYKQKVDVIEQDGVEVNDLLKASKIFIEEAAFKHLAEKFTSLSA